MKCIKQNKHISINKEINMHILTKFFSPFCINKTYMHKQENKQAYINSQNSFPLFFQFINKGAKTNQTIKIYMRYAFMKKRDVKLAPPAYMHYMKKG